MSYELFISRASPYSSKVRALAGYADFSHRVRVQNAVNRYAVIRRLTGKTMVPVLRRGNWAINDSTRIARYMMARSPRPTLPPTVAQTLAWMLEDFADEWMVRWMAHSRWRHRGDAEQSSELIGRELTGMVPVGERLVGRQAARWIRRSMERWGIRPENDDALQSSAIRCLEVLEELLSEAPNFLFGTYPTVTDFAFYGPLVQYRSDPTGADRLRDYPAVQRYIDRLDAMIDGVGVVTGPGRSKKTVDLSRFQPLFAELMGTYWRILVANYRVKARGSGQREVTAPLLDGSHINFDASSYLQGRLEEMLERVDNTYAERDRLFGESGVRMERAVVECIAELCESEAGRRLLKRYRHVGMH